MAHPHDRWPLRRAFRLTHAGRVRADVDAELRFHLDERMEELMAAGLSREAAAAEARRRFGDVGRVEAECATIDTATRRRRSLGEHAQAVARDVRQALRGMAARPGYTATIVLTLALAIGANTAIYSAVRSVLLRPLPVAHLDRLYTIEADLLKLELLGARLSAGEVADLRERTDLFEAVAAVSGTSLTLTGSGEARRLAVARTMGDFAGVFGVRPALGRLYDARASTPGEEFVVVLSHGLWQEQFGGDPGIVGRTISLNDRPYTVTGVMPADFRYPRSATAWVPFALTERALSPEQRGTLIMTPLVRPRAGLDAAALQAGLRGELQRWAAATPEREGYADPAGYRLTAIPLVEHLSGQLRPALLVLLGAVTLVLLIACANVASLQLVRTTGRAREVALRAALGAGRWAIVRQFLVESLALALLGGLGGVLLGLAALRGLARWEVAEFAALADVRLDGAVLAATAGVTLLAGVLFGVVPAWRASRVDAQGVLKEGGGRGTSPGAGRHRLLQGAVVAQLALTLVLLLGSGVLLRSLARQLAVDPGFVAASVTTMQVAPPTSRYSWETRPALYAELLERLRAIPGVEAAALTATLPFSSMGADSSPFTIPGAEPLPGGEMRHANAIPVSPGYFRALGIPLVRGRDFTDADRLDAARVVVIDEQLARQYFADTDPVGRVIDHFGQGLTIVGVARSLHLAELGAAYKATVYYPYAQMAFPSAGIVVRSPLPTGVVAARVREAVTAVDPELPVYDVRPLDERVEGSLGARRLAVTVLGAFAGLALVLALLGAYGVLSYSTSQRARELGIRLALGAAPGAVVGMVLRRGLLLAGAGLGAGVVVYLAVGRLLEALLYGVSPRDPATIVGGVAVLAAAAAVACWVPARRAARVDPAVVLRGE